ncbi:unnamed protein product [Blumeria hordei]|uniref:Hydantoin racemase n=2 Tax=Blumeria hordei TaxID=2867405 RepID=A0A383UU16_BLUHO|nr:/Protein DCG1 [Blumeria hordei DH14]SZF02742.1 unnamed protein product [Blumeria hordei]
MASMKILILNPNSSPTTTDVIDSAVEAYIGKFPIAAQIELYTAPSGPPSIDSDQDALMSAKAIMADLQFKLSDYDAYVVACYSVHPLVDMLRSRLCSKIHVIGIFEASLSTALSLLPMDRPFKYGIISTGHYWKDALSSGVQRYCGSDRFKGVETMGLTNAEFHTADIETKKSKLQEATRSLIRERDVRVICLGCAALSGMNDIMNEVLVDELGEGANAMYIVDGVQAAIGLVESLIRESTWRSSN